MVDESTYNLDSQKVQSWQGGGELFSKRKKQRKKERKVNTKYEIVQKKTYKR